MKGLRFHYSLPRIVASKVLGQVSRSAFTGRFAPLRLETMAEPQLAGRDWVKIRTSLAGICGSDLKQVMLRGAWDNPLTALVSFPHVLGHEAVGVVEEVGPEVSRVRVGQRVLIDPWLSCRSRSLQACGACAAGDFMLCRNFDSGSLPAGIHLGNNSAAPGAFAEFFTAHESQCFALGDDVSDEAAVLADPFSVSLHSILRAPPPSDAPALVYGLGPLGLLALAALAKLYPAVPVYAVGRHRHQCELARHFGAREVLLGGRNDVIARIAKLTGARMLQPWSRVPWLMDGVGVVYDTVGSPESVETSIRVVRARGTVVVSGVEMPRRFEWTPLYFKEVALVGSNAFAIETFAGRRMHTMEAYLQLVRQGLDVTAVITHRFPLARWREAFGVLMQRKSTGAVKVVLTPDAA